jgi:hypothetical protein
MLTLCYRILRSRGVTSRSVTLGNWPMTRTGNPGLPREIDSLVFEAGARRIRPSHQWPKG